MSGKTFLLTRYFNIGWLQRRYYDGKHYHQPFSAEDRLYAGECLYADFLSWSSRFGGLHSIDWQVPRVDGGRVGGNMPISGEAERFRRALRRISKPSMPVIYKIVLEEREIKPPVSFSTRERLYFNDEIKGLLCRGLDEVADYYLMRGGSYGSSPQRGRG